MNANIAQMRANEEKLCNDMRWENRRFLVQFIVAIAAALGTGVAIANYVNSKPVPQVQAPPPQIIYLVPGQAPPGFQLITPQSLPSPAPATAVAP